MRRRSIYVPPPRVVATDGACDGLGTYETRPDGTLASFGWVEPREDLRRALMQCYRDLVGGPGTEAIASHTTKRLYEQLTGRMDAEAAARLALDYRHVTDQVHNKTRTPEDQADMASHGMLVD